MKEISLNVVRIMSTSATVIQAVVIYLFFDAFSMGDLVTEKVFVGLMVVVFLLLCIVTVVVWVKDKF